jgi:hypothetical protein
VRAALFITAGTIMLLPLLYIRMHLYQLGFQFRTVEVLFLEKKTTSWGAFKGYKVLYQR